MTKAEVLNILKADLNLVFVTNAGLNAQLEQMENAAIGLMEREGVTFTKNGDEYAFSPEDAQLVVMYAAYLYRKRATDEAMPRMLRWALNNRIFAEKAGAEDVT